MAYRDDKDLEFLGEMESSELGDLVNTLIFDKGGKKIYTESLTKKEAYKKYGKDYSQYWKDIAEEIQYFGANSIISFFKGKGVLYREIVGDVADKIKIKYDKDFTAKDIENEILIKILNDSLEKMTEDEKIDFIKDMDLKTGGSFTSQAIIMAIQALFKAGGFQSYKITLVVTNAILKAVLGRGLSFAGNAMLTRTAAILTGPIGMTLMGILAIFDIAGPAYRVTIPTVIQIAMLRATYEAKKQKLYEEFMRELNK